MCVRKEAGRTIIFMLYIFFSTWLQGTLSLVCMCFTMQMYMWYVNKSNASTDNLGRWGGGGGVKSELEQTKRQNGWPAAPIGKPSVRHLY